MNTYVVTLLPYGDKMLPYTITVKSDSEKQAIEDASRFVAENGYWPEWMTIEQRMNYLVVDNITMTHSSETTTY